MIDTRRVISFDEIISSQDFLQLKAQTFFDFLLYSNCILISFAHHRYLQVFVISEIDLIFAFLPGSASDKNIISSLSGLNQPQIYLLLFYVKLARLQQPLQQLCLQVTVRVTIETPSAATNIFRDLQIAITRSLYPLKVSLEASDGWSFSS